MRVLVVDDAPAIRVVLGRVLASLGHDVVGEAASLPGGLECARDLAPDAIVVDGRLLADDVVAAVARVRDAAPGTAIVAVVARDEAPFVRAALAAGATHAIRRPIVRSSVAAIFAAIAAEGFAAASDRESRMLRPEAPRNERHG